MEIINCCPADTDKIDKDICCIVFMIHIRVNNVEQRAREMIDIIADNSWISKLDSIAEATYRARSSRTIDKLVNGIFLKVKNIVTDEFGEYLISISAQESLERCLGHNRVPLAEMIKEKIIGNPGFDFHTESDKHFVVFGEAKYSSDGNPHGLAITQIIEFIRDEKDTAELDILRNFVSKDGMENALKDTKSYAAAFSLNSDRPALIFNNALKSMCELKQYPELFLIGVEINDKRNN